MDKVFYVYAAHGDHPDSCTEVFLSLPATPYEMLDAMDKLRLDEGESAEFRVEEYYRFDSLAPFLDKQYGLYELNALAQRLSELDDSQSTAFEGLLKIEASLKKEASYGDPVYVKESYQVSRTPPATLGQENRR